LQPIDFQSLNDNTNWLLNWQKEHRNRKTDGLRLNLGSGDTNIPNYVNVDLYSPKADLKADIRDLPYKSNTVSEIISQHSLEHLPLRQVYSTLRHWYDILQLGGEIELGLPDLELIMQLFLDAPEKEKWGRRIWEVFGAQAEGIPSWIDHEWTIEDDYPFAPGQLHQSGFSLGHLVREMEKIGYRMLDVKNYNGFGTPCIFIYAMKPPVCNIVPTVLERDVICGTFTNRTTFLPDIWRSFNKFVPHIPFATRIRRDYINNNMALMREDFIASGKRFWLFLDHDVQILSSDIIKDALNAMVLNKWAICTTYMTYNPEVLNSTYNPQGLVEQIQPWVVGYFILADSSKIGNILPDLNLPDKNTAIDVSYSMECRKAGYSIGIVPHYLYHLQKHVPHNVQADIITQEYIKKKWGSYYTKCITPINVVIG
jgi:predicted SAM-dependent methyltransferase